MSERKTLQKEVATLDVKFNSLSDIAVQISTLIERFGSDAMVTENNYPYSEDTYLAVYINVPETDEQFKSRLVMEETQRAATEVREKREFARLAAKYSK